MNPRRDLSDIGSPRPVGGADLRVLALHPSRTAV